MNPSSSHLVRWARSPGLETLSLESLTRFWDAVPGVADSFVEFPPLQVASLYPGVMSFVCDVCPRNQFTVIARKETNPDVTGTPTCVRRGALCIFQLHSFIEPSRNAAPLWKPLVLSWCACERGQASGWSSNPTSPWTEYTLNSADLYRPSMRRGITPRAPVDVDDDEAKAAYARPKGCPVRAAGHRVSLTSQNSWWWNPSGGDSVAGPTKPCI